MDRLVRLGLVYDGMPAYLKHKLPSYVQYDADDHRFFGVLRLEGEGSALVERADGTTHFVSGAAVDVFNAFKPGKPRGTAAGNEHWGTEEISFARWSEHVEPDDPLAWFTKVKEMGVQAGPAPLIPPGGRNPPWTAEESGKVLDAFEEAMRGGIPLDLDQIDRISKKLRQHPAVEPGDAATFRSPSAVLMRVAGYMSIQLGLHDCPGCLEERLWVERGLPQGTIKKHVPAAEPGHEIPPRNVRGLLEDEEGPQEAAEGGIRRRIHVQRERDPRLRKEAKRRFLKQHGHIFCEACGFDFEAAYGEWGADTIQVHHTKPVAELEPDEKTNVRDLALLCANCHVIVHRRKPMLSVEEVRALVRGRRTATP